ncbi:MAG TPA: hypothetical protein VKF81_05200 [Blastocatellia bacterium]|nr:hypothetical protein [Blastocatellia bacterium]
MITTKMQRRVRTSGTLVLLGLVIELVSLLWSHPTAFTFFLVPGAFLLAAGTLLYLYSLASVSSSSTKLSDTDVGSRA